MTIRKQCPRLPSPPPSHYCQGTSHKGGWFHPMPRSDNPTSPSSINIKEIHARIERLVFDFAKCHPTDEHLFLFLKKKWIEGGFPAWLYDLNGPPEVHLQRLLNALNLTKKDSSYLWEALRIMKESGRWAEIKRPFRYLKAIIWRAKHKENSSIFAPAYSSNQHVEELTHQTENNFGLLDNFLALDQIIDSEFPNRKERADVKQLIASRLHGCSRQKAHLFLNWTPAKTQRIWKKIQRKQIFRKLSAE